MRIMTRECTCGYAPAAASRNEHGQLGDVSTLAEPGVVNELVENRMNRG